MVEVRYKYRRRYPYNDTIYEESLENNQGDSKSSITANSDMNNNFLFLNNPNLNDSSKSKQFKKKLLKTVTEKQMARKSRLSQNGFEENPSKFNAKFRNYLKQQKRDGAGHLNTENSREVEHEFIEKDEDFIWKNNQVWANEKSKEMTFKFYSPNCSNQKPQNYDLRSCVSNDKEINHVNNHNTKGKKKHLGIKLFEERPDSRRLSTKNKKKKMQKRTIKYTPESPFIFKTLDTVDDILDSQSLPSSSGKKRQSQYIRNVVSQGLKEKTQDIICSTFGSNVYKQTNNEQVIQIKKRSHFTENKNKKIIANQKQSSQKNEIYVQRLFKIQKKYLAKLTKILVNKFQDSIYMDCKHAMHKLRNQNKFCKLDNLMINLQANRKKNSLQSVKLSFLDFKKNSFFNKQTINYKDKKSKNHVFSKKIKINKKLNKFKKKIQFEEEYIQDNFNLFKNRNSQKVENKNNKIDFQFIKETNNKINDFTNMFSKETFINENIWKSTR